MGAQEQQCVQALSDLGRIIGIPGLALDAHGCCQLLFDGDRTIAMRPALAQCRWLLSCTLRKMPLQPKMMPLLLRANYMGAGFSGGWVGMDEQDLCVLHLPIPLEQISGEGLLSAVEALLEHCDRWELRVKHLQDELVSTSSDTAFTTAQWALRI